MALDPNEARDEAPIEEGMKRSRNLTDDFHRVFGNLEEYASDEVRRASAASQSSQSQMYLSLLLSIGLLLLFTFYFLLRVAHWVTGPMALLHEGAGKVSEGDFSHRIDVSQGGEFGDLARSFNAMARSLGMSSERLSEKLRQSELLIEVAQVANSTLELQTILQRAVDLVAERMKREEGGLVAIHSVLRDVTFLRKFAVGIGAVSLLLSAFTLSEVAARRSPGLPYGVFQDASGRVWMADFQAHLQFERALINDPKRDDRFKGVRWDETIRSLICVPMIVKSVLIGTLTVYYKKGSTEFSEDDQRLLSIIAAQSAQIVENARLYEEELRLRKMQEELQLASRIQMDLLPKAVPEIPGYEVAGKTLPAQQVGGDYFDFIKISDNRWAFCLGDVSGKGLPASLLMANLQATLRGQTLSDLKPADCIRRSNRLLYYSTSPEKFATVFYGILDRERHTLKFSNAGHDHPYILHTRTNASRLQTGGVPLGMLEEFPFEEEEVPMSPGDLLVVYSDGVTEAWNTDEIEFGEQRLAEVLSQHQDKTASELIDGVVAAVKSHTGSAPQADDITLVVLKRLQ